MPNPTLLTGARYRLKHHGAWVKGSYVGCFLNAHVWAIDGIPLHTSNIQEIGDPIINVAWVRDPFAATVRMSAMVRVVR